ncbi:MAG: AlpA family phage regulatory protein [Methylotenera sp.]|nr:AlpA family phage regulatory protein [Methylotenera sp.]
MTKDILKIHEVEALADISKSTIYRLMSLGRFPKPESMRDLPSRKVWRKNEVIEWCNSQVA